MPLIIPGKPQIDFFLRTTKPFHNERAVKDFFRIVLSYGPDYRPVKYGRSEPVKELFDEKHLEKAAFAWLGGNDCTSEILESQYCLSQLMMKGRSSSKVTREGNHTQCPLLEDCGDWRYHSNPADGKRI